MSDIVERLRHPRWTDRSTGKYTDTYDLLGVEAERLEAADMIEWLQKKLIESNERNLIKVV